MNQEGNRCRMTGIFIATPVAGGFTPIAYSQSLIAATVAISQAGRSYRFLSIDGAGVVLARNALSHIFLQDKNCEYILFLDSDMDVDVSVFNFLLAARRPIVGAIYAKKTLDLPRYAQAFAEQGNDRRARAMASSFNVLLAPGEQRVTDNLMEVAAFGCGCVLIHRSVFEALITDGSVDPVVSSSLAGLGVTGTVHDFFSEIRLPSGELMSEDYSFCSRVRALGNIPLLGYVGDGVGHVGNFTYSGPYIERLKSGLS